MAAIQYKSPATAFDPDGCAWARTLQRECFTLFRVEEVYGEVRLHGESTWNGVDAALEQAREQIGDPRKAPTYLLGYEIRSTTTGKLATAVPLDPA